MESVRVMSDSDIGGGAGLHPFCPVGDACMVCCAWMCLPDGLNQYGRRV